MTTENSSPPTTPRVALAGAIVALVALAAILGWWFVGRALCTETTDDAFLEGHVTAVCPQVAGVVAAVSVRDNEPVRAGQLLVELDPRDYQTRLAQARAALAESEARQRVAEAGREQAQSHLLSLQADAAAAVADRQAAEAEATRRAGDAARARQLFGNKTIAGEEFDHARAADLTAAAVLEAARKKASSKEALAGEARQQVTAAQAQIKLAAALGQHAAAAVQQAELDLSYTKITAAVAGRVTVRAVEPGAYVAVGQSLLALVPRAVWVLANFKETQLAHLRPGQPAELRVDAYPDRQFHGRVDSVQAGTGARFSLLPPENAVGNYIKVVQRVPVKIVFDPLPGDEVLLGPGLSVVPVVSVGPYPVRLVVAGAIVIVAAAVATVLWLRRRRQDA